jgi:hypothetical protein
MATIDSTPVSLDAAADLSAKLYRFGKMTSTGINVCSVLGERADGVIGSKPTAVGQAVALYQDRIFQVECGGSIDKGGKITTDANGKAVAHTSGYHVNGVALEAGVDGKFISVLAPFAVAPTAEAESVVAVSAPGAIPVTASHVLLSVDGTDAFTLADGDVGHELTIDCVAAANTPLGTVTINDAYGSEPTSWVFTAVGQKLTLRMTSGGWKVIGLQQAGTDLRTTDGAFNPLCSLHTFEVADTKAYSLADGLVAGQLATFVCTANSGTPAGTITASFRTLAGATSASFSANASGDYAHCVWTGSKWQALVINSVTFA